MTFRIWPVAMLALLVPASTAAVPYKSPDTILAGSPASDWKTLDSADTLYMDLPGGRVVILLAPTFAPKTIANIKALVHERYFDDSSIIRSQDDYVVEWSQENKEKRKGKLNLKGYVEFERPVSSTLMQLPDRDTYAEQTGFDGGFAAGSDGKSEWLLHCYGMVGVPRDNAADSGTGVELYAVIGQAPRQLDRNITLVGRVVLGMELLSTLPRGSGTQGQFQGYYQNPQQYTAVSSIRLASEIPAANRISIQVLRTKTKTFAAYIESLRNRRNDWFVRPAGAIDACNIPLPVRVIQ